MGILDIFKKAKPVQDDSNNFMYDLLFCEVDVYRKILQSTDYPWNILLAENPEKNELYKILNDEAFEPRVKAIATNILRSNGEQIEPKKLFAVIVEVAFDKGIDGLASFADGTGRFLHHSGQIIVWETTDETSENLTSELFNESQKLVNELGPWEKS